MPKRSRIEKFQEDPTFERAVTDLESFKKIRLSETSALSLLLWLVKVKLRPTQHTAAVSLWNAFCQVEGEIRDSTQKIERAMISDDELILLSKWYFDVKSGLENFLPECCSLTRSSEQKRYEAFIWYLLITGGRQRLEDPFLLAKTCAFVTFSWPFVCTEVTLRGMQHIGTKAGWLICSSKTKDVTNDADKARLKVIRHIVKAVKRRFIQANRIPPTRDEIEDQVIDTLLKEYGISIQLRHSHLVLAAN